MSRAYASARVLAVLSALGCTPECPDTFPLCVELTDGGAGCRAWSAGCCSGIVVCAKGTTFADDAGICDVVPVPDEKRPACE